MEMRWNARRPMGLTGLPDEALPAPPHVRLAWLLGRTDRSTAWNRPACSDRAGQSSCW